MSRVYMILILGLALSCRYAAAEERLKLDKTTILGNGELPKVTFVVPWRDVPSAIPAWVASPVARPLTKPLDRELYQRQVDYLRQLNHAKDPESAR
jgi:hypothetical protein